MEAVLQESDNLYTAFRTAEAAGEGPDIQYMWGGTQAMEDVWKGNVAPISDYISEEELSVIPKSALAQTNWNGKQWGIPAYGLHMGLPMIRSNAYCRSRSGKSVTTWMNFRVL